MEANPHCTQGTPLPLSNPLERSLVSYADSEMQVQAATLLLLLAVVLVVCSFPSSSAELQTLPLLQGWWWCGSC